MGLLWCGGTGICAAFGVQKFRHALAADHGWPFPQYAAKPRCSFKRSK